MAPSANRFKHQSLEDTESIIKYLEALKEGFESGALLFSSDGRQLMVKPHGLINLDVEARYKSGEFALTLKLNWTEEGSGRNKENAPLQIQPVTKS